jgi:hypothetical protein
MFAVGFGLFAGVALGSSTLVYDGFYPALVGFNSIPKVAVIPILVIWFGIGTVPAIITAFLISFFPIMVNGRCRHCDRRTGAQGRVAGARRQAVADHPQGWAAALDALFSSPRSKSPSRSRSSALLSPRRSRAIRALVILCLWPHRASKCRSPSPGCWRGASWELVHNRLGDAASRWRERAEGLNAAGAVTNNTRRPVGPLDLRAAGPQRPRSPVRYLASCG